MSLFRGHPGHLGTSPSRASQRYRLPALVLLVLHLQACASWAPATTPPRELIAQEEPSSIRITRTDGTREVMRDPQVEGDSIVAMGSEECRSSAAAGGRVFCETTTSVAALSDVRAMEVRRPNTARTFVAVVAAVPVALALAFVVVMQANCGALVCG